MAKYTIKKLIDSLDGWDPDSELVFKVNSFHCTCGPKDEYCYCDSIEETKEINLIEDEIFLKGRKKEQATGRIIIRLD